MFFSYGTPMARLKHHPMAYCLFLAFFIRLSLALGILNFYAADELFQYLQQAHNLVFHQGVISWEYQTGLRSLLIPLLLAAPMKLALLFSSSPVPGLMFTRAVLCVPSLSIVWCAVKWGEALQERRGAWAAGLLCALWPSLWLVAPHPMEESFSAYCFTPAIYLAWRHHRESGWNSLALSALLLGFSFAFRQQLAPAIAIAGIYLCWRSPKAWLLGLSIAALPVIATGFLDFLAWGQWFRSFWMNFYLNMGLHIADGYFGTSSVFYFPRELLHAWLWSALPFCWLAWKGAKQLPAAGLIVAAILIEHTMLAHKETRFIFPAIALAAPLAGIGLAAIWPVFSRRARIILLAALASGPILTPYFWMTLAWQHRSVQFYLSLAKTHPHLVAVEDWGHGLQPAFPLFGAGTAFTSTAGANQADAIVALKGKTTIPPGFTLRRCAHPSWVPFTPAPEPDLCFWTRPFAQPSNQPAPVFELVFPPAARPFIVHDNLLRLPGAP